MCTPIVGTWMKFNLENGQRVIGRVTKADDVSVTIDNAEPATGGFHKGFVFAKSEVGNCGPAYIQKEPYAD